MSTPKLISPLLDNFMMGDPISDIDGVRCCPAMHQQTQEKYLVKIISVPASQTKLEALLLTGAYPDVESAAVYFKQQADEITAEADIIAKLSHNSGFEGFEAYQVVPMDDGTGFDIYLLCPYKKTLKRHCQIEPATHLLACNMALDVCAALASCRNQGYIFVNLKPENIVIGSDNSYRINDLGLLPLASLKYASVPDRYFSPYTAPELCDAFASPNETVDTYALGMILYEIYNGGLPFEGNKAPAEEFPAPKFADEEISQIILKAIAPNAQERWQTPAQMGQALVACIQRNGLSDTPIVILPEEPEVTDEPADIEADEVVTDEVITEETTVDAAEEAEEMAEEAELGDTADESEAAVIIADEASVSEEITAEEAMQEPEDAPAELEETVPAQEDETPVENTEAEEAAEEDPIAVIMEEPAAEEEITEEAEPAIDEPQADEQTEAEEFENLSFMEEDAAEDIDSILDQVEALLSDDEEHESDSEEPQEDIEDEEESKEPAPVKKRKKGWIGWLIAAILLIGIAVGGYFFYTMYYLQPVNDLSVNAVKDTVVIEVDSSLDSSELNIVLTDAFSEATVVPLTDGKATISGLQPNMNYTITVEANTFHKLTGETTATFTTQKQTEVLNLTVVTGNAAGTAELSFQVNGPDSENWTAIFTAEGETDREISVVDHKATIEGLTVGTTYQVSIKPADELFLIGTKQVSFTASDVIVADYLAVTYFADAMLSVSWLVPDGVQADSWNVLCTSASGDTQLLTVTDTEASFSGIDHAVDYTVTVTAANQSVSIQKEIKANAPTITGISTSVSDGRFTVSWSAPQGDWKVFYQPVGSEHIQSATCAGTSFTAYDAIPGQTYNIIITTADGVAAAHPITTVTLPGANDFTGYTVSRNNMQFRMCKTPAKANWSHTDLADSDYTTTFTSGKKASFLIRLNKTYNTSPDNITTLFVIKDADGNIVDTCSSASSWTNMWYKGYCELDIPHLPTAAGIYTVTVYFNGGFAYSGSFTITQ